jgi:hypothetical protein
MHCDVAVNSAKVADQITTLVAERRPSAIRSTLPNTYATQWHEKFFDRMTLQSQPPHEKRMAADQFSL